MGPGSMSSIGTGFLESFFLMERYLARLRHKGRALVRLQHGDGTDFVDFPWEVIPSMRRGGGVRGRCGEQGEGREGEPG